MVERLLSTFHLFVVTATVVPIEVAALVYLKRKKLLLKVIVGEEQHRHRIAQSVLWW